MRSSNTPLRESDMDFLLSLQENFCSPLKGICNEDTFSWKEIIHMIALASNKLTWKIPAPVLPIKILASILESFEWFPITKDQLTMLMEGNIVSEQYFNEFKINAIPFSIENLSYLKK